jgi:hypothetical protein
MFSAGRGISGAKGDPPRSTFDVRASPRRSAGTERGRSPLSESLGHLLARGSGLVRGSVPCVAGARAGPAPVVGSVQPPLVQAARRLTFRRHFVLSLVNPRPTQPGRTLKDSQPLRPKAVRLRPGSSERNRPSMGPSAGVVPLAGDGRLRIGSTMCSERSRDGGHPLP